MESYIVIDPKISYSSASQKNEKGGIQSSILYWKVSGSERTTITTTNPGSERETEKMQENHLDKKRWRGRKRGMEINGGEQNVMFRFQVQNWVKTQELKDLLNKNL